MKKMSIILFLISLIFSCVTNPSVGKLTGNIQLEGETDYSEITVAIYDLAVLDTTIVRINNEYPHIGVIINQHTEFDHRLQSPIKYSETDADGNFKIKDIPTGNYNVVAIKDGFGFKYLYEVNIAENDNELDQGITLHHEEYFSGTIQEDWIFETDHHYIIEDDTDFHPNFSLEIQPGAVVRINPGIDFTIHGNLLAQGEEDNMFWVTSNDGFSQNLILNEDIDFYNSMELSSVASVSNDLIEWGKADFANFGIMLDSDGVNVNNMIFRNSLCGLSSSSVNSTQCENVSCYNISHESLGGIFFLNVTNGFIRKSALINSNYGILIKHSFLGNIDNNYFANNEIGLSVWSTECCIEHNEFSNNSNRNLDFVGNNDTVSGDGELEICYNNFYSENGVVQWTPSGSYDRTSSIIVNNNNFENSDLCIVYQSIRLNGIIDATNNYFFGLISEEAIYDKIFDSTESDPNHDMINISSFQENRIQDAGIE